MLGGRAFHPPEDLDVPPKKKPKAKVKARPPAPPTLVQRLREDAKRPAAEWLPIQNLVPWDANPKRHPEAQVERLAATIRDVGWGEPIVARRKDLRVVAGHARLEAARLLKLEVVPVRLVDLDDAQATRMALADNRLAELGEWDEEALGALLEEVPEELRELAGWTADELEQQRAGEEAAVPAPKAKRTHGRNPAPYTVTLNQEQQKDVEQAWGLYRQEYPEAHVGELVAYLARDYLRAKGLLPPADA